VHRFIKEKMCHLFLGLARGTPHSSAATFAKAISALRKLRRRADHKPAKNYFPAPWSGKRRCATNAKALEVRHLAGLGRNRLDCVVVVAAASGGSLTA